MLYPRLTLSPFLICLLFLLMLNSLSAQRSEEHRSRPENPPFSLPDQVTLHKNVSYKQASGQDLQLDIYAPAGTEVHPAVVFIHGGGWRSGTRDHFRRQAAYLADQGWVAVTVSYRLSGTATFPAAIEDCKCAIRWLRAHASRYHIDPDRIAVAGGSAGGHLAALVGTAGKDAELEGKDCYPEQSSEVQAVVAFNGVFDMTPAQSSGPTAGKAIRAFLGSSPQDAPDLYRKASPITYVDPSDPPFLLLHGTQDTSVPFEESLNLKKRLEEAGVRVELYPAEGANHSFFNNPPFFEPSLKRMEEFLDSVLGAQ